MYYFSKKGDRLRHATKTMKEKKTLFYQISIL